ncbi:MAG: glycosyltransferase [Patescibacteria group bacterium]
MKIGLIHNLSGSDSRGGAEAVVKAQAQELQSQGHDLFMVSTKNKNKPEEIVPTSEPRSYYLNSDFYNLGRHGLLYRAVWQIGNILSFWKYRRLRKILQTEKPDLIVTHNLMGLGYLTPIAIRRQKARHEHVLHDIQLLHPSGLMLLGQENKINNPAAKVYQTITRGLIGSPDQIVSPSAWLLKLHQQHKFFPHSATKVSPWLSEKSLPPAAKILTNQTAKLVDTPPPTPITNSLIKKFLFVGQIENHKGVFFLINVFKNLNKPNFLLTIVGNGTQFHSAQAAAAPHKNIRFLGRQAAATIHEIMLNNDYLIVPSLCYENSPRVIYEAKSLGLPVIAANLGGIPEMLTASDILFRPGDATDLISKLNNLA